MSISYTCEICKKTVKSIEYHVDKYHKLKYKEYKIAFGLYKPKKSVYQLQYWLEKGYTEEQAKYEISIRRSTNINYWINKGFSVDEAKEKLLSQSKRGLELSQYIERYGEVEGIKKYNERLEKCKHDSPRCIEYWLKQGYNEHDAMQQVSHVQNTRGYDVSIEKYGHDEGIEYVKNINNKWQTTLKNKSEEELNRINKKKSTKNIEYFISTSNNPIIDFIESNHHYTKNEPKSIYAELKYIAINLKTIDDYLNYLTTSDYNIKKIKKIIKSDAMQFKYSYGKFGSKTILDILNCVFTIFKVLPKIDGLFGNRYIFNGDVLLSDAELEIAQWLYSNDINYKYSYRYPFSIGKSKNLCDFYLTDQSIYIEYAGLTDLPEYNARIRKKIQLCIENNLNYFCSSNTTDIINFIKLKYEKND